jgi:glycerophosphoryl diester phosphodiesterase
MRLDLAHWRGSPEFSRLRRMRGGYAGRVREATPRLGPLLYAHRGAPLELPENSLVGFARALELGADALEIDVHMTRDGHVVVCHDASGERIAGVARQLRDCTLSEIKQWELRGPLTAGSSAGTARVPALDEVLEAFPQAHLNIDIKQHAPEVIDAVLAVIAKHAAAQRVLLTSFSSAITRGVRARGYAGRTGFGRAEVVGLVFAPARVLSRVRSGGSRAQIPRRFGPIVLDRPELIDKLHALGLAVDYWVVNETHEAQRLLARGADGIVTDDVRAMAQLFATSPHTQSWRARHPS